MARLQQSFLDRTFRFGLDCIHAAQDFPRNPAGWHIAGQLVASGTSVHANSREANTALTVRSFVHKINVARTEAGEAQGWIAYALALGWRTRVNLQTLSQEGQELYAILSTIEQRSSTRIASSRSVTSRPRVAITNGSRRS